jgi:hypothetical protein
MRLTFNGTLCVYRESAASSGLCAHVTLGNGKVIYWDPCPKCFDDVITDPTKNSALVSFSANEDGTNPRNVNVHCMPFRQQRS